MQRERLPGGRDDSDYKERLDKLAAALLRAQSRRPEMEPPRENRLALGQHDSMGAGAPDPPGAAAVKCTWSQSESLDGAPPVQPRVFISYAHNDANAVRPIKEALKAKGVSCWFDTDQLELGMRWVDEVARAVAHCTHLIFFASAKSVASQYCGEELMFAYDERKSIVVFYIEPRDEVVPKLPPSLEMRLGIHRFEFVAYNSSACMDASASSNAITAAFLKLTKGPVCVNCVVDNGHPTLALKSKPRKRSVSESSGTCGNCNRTLAIRGDLRFNDVFPSEVNRDELRRLRLEHLLDDDREYVPEELERVSRDSSSAIFTAVALQPADETALSVSSSSRTSDRKPMLAVEVYCSRTEFEAEIRDKWEAAQRALARGAWCRLYGVPTLWDSSAERRAITKTLVRGCRLRNEISRNTFLAEEVASFLEQMAIILHYLHTKADLQHGSISSDAVRVSWSEGRSQSDPNGAPRFMLRDMGLAVSLRELSPADRRLREQFDIFCVAAVALEMVSEGSVRASFLDDMNVDVMATPPKDFLLKARMYMARELRAPLVPLVPLLARCLQLTESGRIGVAVELWAAVNATGLANDFARDQNDIARNQINRLRREMAQAAQPVKVAAGNRAMDIGTSISDLEPLTITLHGSATRVDPCSVYELLLGSAVAANVINPVNIIQAAACARLLLRRIGTGSAVLEFEMPRPVVDALFSLECDLQGSDARLLAECGVLELSTTDRRLRLPEIKQRYWLEWGSDVFLLKEFRYPKSATESIEVGSSRVIQVLKPVNEAGGRVSVPKAAQSTLSDTRHGFRFVSILGPTRTGKSYLANCLVGTEDLFAVQNRNSLTIGIDTNEPALSFEELLRRHKISDIRKQPDQCSMIRFLDTEGMGDREAWENDLQVVLPAIAAASVVVVNFSGRLGLNRFLGEVGFLAYACKQLLRQEAREIRTAAGSSSASSSSRRPPLGHLHIVFRNWTNADTAEEYQDYLFEQYPENATRELEENTASVRDAIKRTFASVTVHTVPPPCEADVIQRTSSIPFSELSSSFIKKIHHLVRSIAIQLSQPMTHLLAPLHSTEARAVDFIHALARSIGSSGALDLDFSPVMQVLHQQACARARHVAMERWRRTASTRLLPPVNAGTLAAATRELAFECERIYESEATSAGVPNVGVDREENKGLLRRELAQWAADVAFRNAGALRDFFAEAVAKARAELRGRAAALRDAPGVIEEAALREKVSAWAEDLADELLSLAASRRITAPDLEGIPDADASAFACPEIDKAIQEVYRAAEDEGMVLVQHMAVKRDAAASRALMGAERTLREAVARLPLPMGAAALDAALATARQAAGGANPPREFGALADAIEADARNRNVAAAAASLQSIVHRAMRAAQSAPDIDIENWEKSTSKELASEKAREAFQLAGLAGDVPGLSAAREALEKELVEECESALRACSREREEAARRAQHASQMEKMVLGMEQMKLDNRRLTEDLEKIASEGQKRLQSLERNVMEAARAAAQRPMLDYGGGGGGGGGWDMCSYSPGPGRSSGGGRSYAGGGRTIYTGPRGGQYYINSNGNKTYLQTRFS
eukprot:tig00000113_g5608.t2